MSEGIHDRDRTERDERALLARIAAGDRVAFETLFSSYGSRIFRYAMRMIGDVGKAEEVTNDVMIEVWKSAASYEGRSRPSTWILGITRHRALNAVRGKPRVTVDIDDPSVALESEDTGEREADASDARRTLREAVLELSREHREVIELTFYHGCSYQEIADIVGCPENTVKTRMFHAKKRLREILKVGGRDVALGVAS